MTSARYFDPRGLKYSAIAIGIVVDLGAMVGLGVSLVVAAFLVLVVRSETPVEDNPAVQVLFAPILIEVGATLCSILGGFVAGVIAKRDELRHGVFTGIGVVVALPLLVLIPADGSVAVSDAIATVIVIPACAAGGWLAARRRRRAQAATPP